ncbi:MAG TPA: LamG-like jellyroll fold domain-containing protein [Actinoplanes sp.]|nr:LamG-like jellyroll fold domain-containing protein [Actinoplanes sp.]
MDLRLAGRADAAELVRATLPGGGVLAYGAADARPVPGSAAGDTAVYRGVWPGVDIEVQAQPGGVKETLVLGSAQARRTFVFPLRLAGLRAAVDGDRVVLTDAAGLRRATIPAGFMVDADGAVSHDVSYRLTTHAGAAALQVTAGAKWLAAQGRAYPVRLDPPVLAEGAATESLVVQGSASHGGGSDLLVGRRDGKNSASYLRFPGLVSQLANHTIFSAQLSFAAYQAPSCRPRTLSVHPVTGSWTSGATNQSYPGPAVGAALASSSFAQGYVGLGQSSSACPVTGTVLNLGSKGRDLVQGWVNGTKPHHGLSLRAPVSDESAWKVIAGTGTANPPKLYVTHTPYNAKYAVPDPTPEPAVLQNQAGKVKVTVTNTSAMDWTASGYRLIYRVYNARTNARVGQYVAATLPATLPRTRSVTLEATIRALPIGDYLIDFSMATANGRVVFTDEMVPPARIALRVENIAPVVGDLFPPNGYQSPTLTPQLWAQAVDLDAPPKSTLQYKFETCAVAADGKPTGCTATAYQAKQAFTVPAGRFTWSTPYLWRAFVKDNADEVTTDYATLITDVPQPEITSRIANAPYGSQDRDFDPDLGNFSTGAVDANVATVGPPLKVVRTYNSLDPRTTLAFGTGWMSQVDMRVEIDKDGSGNALVTYPDGQQVRFGRNGDNTYAAPLGRTANLRFDTALGLYILKDSAATTYEFRGGDGKIKKITDKFGRALEFLYTPAGLLATMQSKPNAQNTAAGRALTFGWTGSHITSVSTDQVGGRRLTWTYAYEGDRLARVCSPGTVSCTTYSYADGSHYRSAVLDSNPDSYWRLGEKAGSTAAGSEILTNLGQDAGVARNVTFEQAGALAGTDHQAALFNGSTSVVDLPKGIIKRSRDTAVELWFKVTGTQTGGPLLGYQDKAVDAAPTTGVPLLYVGTDGRVRGQFKTTSATPNPIVVGPDIRGNSWHHVVLSVSADVQTLYLDGQHIASKAVADGVLDHSLLTFNQVGAAWATSPSAWSAWGTSARRTFNGSIDEVAVYGHALSEQSVKAHWQLGQAKADQLSVVTLPSGKVASETVYDTANDRVREYTDGNGGTWKVGLPTVYGGATDLRRAVQVLDPADRAYLYEYDALAGRMLRAGSPLGISTRPEDRPPTPSPTPSPTPTEVCSTPDPGEPQFCTTIPGNAGGPVFSEGELTGMVIRSFGYDAKGRQNLIVNENGATLSLEFDDRGNVTSRKTCRKVGDCQTTYTKFTTPSATNPFDPRNDLPIEVRDPRSASATATGFETVTTYSTAGEVLTETGPDKRVTTTDYTNGGQPAVNPNTDFQPAGLPSAVTDTENRVTRYRYNAAGDLTSVTTPSGLVTESTYDALGRKIQDREKSDSYPDGVVTTYTYDDMGRPLTTTGPVTANAVDGTRHQAVTTTTYDVDGNVIRTVVRDALNATEPERVTTIEYDEFNRQIRTVNPEGDEQTEGWDQFGNRTTVVDGNGNHYEYAYTARNDLAEVRLYDWRGDPDGGRPQDDRLGYIVLNSYAYDYGGRMAAQVDSMGRRLEYTYFGDDLLAKIVLKNFHNPDGTTRDYVVQENEYDPAGNLIRQAAGNGLEVVTNTINALGRTATTTFDPGGLNRSTVYTYDSLGNVTATEQTGKASNVPWPTEAGAKLRFVTVFNAKGQLEKEQVVDGARMRVTSYSYDQRGMVLTTTDPRGNAAGADKAAFTTTYRYDENGDRIQSIAPRVDVESGGNPAVSASPTVTTGYNAFGEVVATKDARGHIARTKYDRMGRAVEVTGPLYTPAGSPGTGAAPVTKLRYDPLGNVVETTDARNNTTRYRYDRLNRLIEEDQPAATDDERAVTRYTYTRTGKLLSTVSPTGIRTEATYDDLDRQVTATAYERKPVADTFTTTIRYDDAGNVVETRSPGGLVTKMTYNKAGEPLTRTDPAQVVTQYGYDAFGNTVRETDGAGRTTRRDYDGFGQVTAEIDLKPDGSELRREKFTYDENGNVRSRVNALDKTVSFEYDALDRLVRQIEPKSATASITTSFGYDAAGNRTRYTDGRQLSTFYGVNSLGLPETVIEPATTAHPAPADRSWTVAYDLNGNAERLTAPGGVIRDREFDAANRMIGETGTGAGAGVHRGTTYDLEDRPTAVSSGTGSNTYEYDDRGNLLRAAGESGTASFAYDRDSQVITRTDAVGTATFGYRSGRIDTMQDAASGVTQTLRYNAAGLPEKVDYGAGRVRTYTYDDFGRLAGDVLRNNAGAEVARIAYRYDLDDHLIGKDTAGTAGAGSNTYGYDDAGRMTSWTSASGTVAYEWDDSGNRIKAGPKTATYDQRNRLLSDSDYTYAYTPRGTMASRTSSGLTDTYSFDAFDRLVSSEGQSYRYDGLNRVINRAGKAFAYAGFEPDAVNDGTESYARGPGGELLAVEDGTDQTRITVSDEHDDVVAAFDPDSTLTGLAGSTAYDPYGQRIAEAGVQSNVGYQGDWTDPGTGQVNMGARWYEPGTGTFTSRDTVTYAEGDSILANKYTYGAGDPMSHTDPTGNWPSCGWCKKAVSAVSGAVRTAWNYTKQAVSYTGAWLAQQARAAWAGIKRVGTAIVNGVKNTIRAIGNAIKSGYQRYIQPTLNRAQDFAARKAAEIRKAAIAVQAKAKAAISTAVKNVSLKRIGSAVKAGLSSLKLTVSAALPAKLVQSFNSVVQDMNAAANALYKQATAAGGAIVSGLQKAGEWVVDHKAQIIGGIAGAVVGVGCGALIGWTGVGAVACAAAGGAIGSLVADLVEGGKGWREMAANALMGGTIGAVLGPLSSVGGSAVTGAVRGLISGGVSKAVSMGSSAAAGSLRSIGSTQVGGLVGKAMAGRGAGSMGREAVESAGVTARSPLRATAEGSCPNSFAPATAVVMADGTTKRIGDVKVGDLVLATDPTTGRTEKRAVTALIIGVGEKRMVELTVDVDGDKGDRTATITATDGHPFWAPDLRRWVDAGELAAGSMLQTGAGTYVRVDAVKRWTAQKQRVHNLTVDGLHTYYVGAANRSVLVHNCPRPLGFSGTSSYRSFVSTLDDGLEAAGLGNTRAAFQGSSVTGRSFRTGRPFGSHSDYDVALGGDDIFERAKGLGIKLRSGKTRTGPLTARQVRQLGLQEMREQLTEMAGRPVNFMVYDSLDRAVARSPSLPTAICECG